ncbi:hypothetical protein AVEN_156191-1 [Araneus ventricosus]|uniref:Uncharacterized protein n=1 Tax=Araneus ventricosus TaxID=182803 RepID=A0A4Y2EX04_ARAVE|nr:hypothetical protein AVEN_156191-1 [Araneus ventricosus]
MDSLPKHMIHLGDGIFTLVNSFIKETRVHIRVYSTDDKAREDPDAVSVIKKNVCLLSHTVDSEKCVSIQRLFQRKDSGFQLVPERILLKGEQITRLYTSYTRIFDYVKTCLLTYTLAERVRNEIKKYPDDGRWD